MTWEFHLNNGQNGVKEIVEPLIINEEIATQRAKSEFLDIGYLKRFVTLTTYRTDLMIGDVIDVEGFTYRVQSVIVKFGGGATMSTITGVRYE